MPLTDDRNRLKTVRVGGRPLDRNVQEQTLSATMSYSALQTGEFTLVVQDTPEADIANARIFTRGTSIDYGPQRMTIRTISHDAGAGGPLVTIKARPATIAALRKQTGKHSWGTVRIDKWAADRVSQAHGKIVAQNLGTESITRQDSHNDESSMDVLTRLATEAGAWCYEIDQTIYLGRPSWIAKRPEASRWRIRWDSHHDYTDQLTSRPAYRASDDLDPGEQLTVTMLDADDIRPGHIFDYAGRVADAKGLWIITDISLPIDATQTATVNAQRITDPKPTKAA